MKKHSYFIFITGKAIAFLLIIMGLVYIFSLFNSSVTENVDPFVYQLPFQEGGRYRVVQGYGGLFSHRNMACLDFDMPEGTPVFAARGGIVYRYKEDSDEGGPFPWYQKKANFIIIQHSDSSFGCYWHLKKNGVVATHGEVKIGELIGYSGGTGLVLAAHLHFSVKTKLNYTRDAFLRTRFRTTDAIEFLGSGKTYERPIQ